MNPHLEQPIVYKGQPVTPGQPVVLAFHGRNQTTDVVVDIFERLGWHNAALIAPVAANHSWYPGRFMDAIEHNQPHLSYALERVGQLIAQVRESGVQQEHIILMGFSQGACLVAEYALRHAGRYGGLAIFTGGAIGPEGTRWEYPGSFQQTPALITTGETDEWVPAGRVRETAVLLREKEAAVTEKIFVGREHVVCDEEIALARRLFNVG
jgi:predicted esterase